jgi:PBP1b-binding outer membrane lipoprotein LpoB
MKKLFSFAALVALVGTVLLAGCKQEEAPPAPEHPAPPADTNAPAK